jgi:prepilin-type N-terminal cleavage/methylation domain-containing protein
MPIPLRNKRASQAGFSLVELLVGLVISTIVGTMMVAGWISLQRSYAFAQRTNTARSSARFALDRISSEVRDCQPRAGANPMTPFTSASPYLCGPYQCVFYSSYNQATAYGDGSGNKSTVLLKTMIYLDQTVSSDQKPLVLWRDTNNNGTFDAADRKIVLAQNVVNDSAALGHLPIFTYYYKVSGAYVATNTPDLSKLVSEVQARLVIDTNLARAPKYIDLTTMVHPRNAGAN